MARSQLPGRFIPRNYTRLVQSFPSDGTEEVSCFAVKLRQAGQLRDRSGQASVEWGEEADSRRIRQPFRAIGLASIPVALGVALECAGEFGIALAAPDGALDEIDAASQIGEPGGACEAVEGGQDGGQRQWQVQGSKLSLWPGPGRSGAGRRRCSPTGREIPTPPNSTTKSAARSSESSKPSATRMTGCSKSMATCRACLKRIVELKDLHRSSSPGTMIHGFATWRSRRLPGGGF